MKGQHPLTALKIFVVVVSLGLTTGSTIAQEKKVVDNYRSTVMSGIDAHMQSIKAITEGKVPFWHHLPDHAVAIVGTSRSLLEIFPDKMSKTNGGETRNHAVVQGCGNALQRGSGSPRPDYTFRKSRRRDRAIQGPRGSL